MKTYMSAIINKIRLELKQNGDEKTRKSSQRFFKEKIKFYGVKNPVAYKIGKKHFDTVKSKGKAEIFDLCEELWQSRFMEESLIACNWSYYVRSEYEPKDFKIFKKWVGNYVDNWASCDTLCNHSIGAFVETYPECVSDLKKWTASSNRWMRRASAVSLIIPARKGKFMQEIFEIADALLLDEDDLVQKGYGWMLKAASQAHQEQVFNYVVKKKSIMPRTALRYAIEKMPLNLRREAMGK